MNRSQRLQSAKRWLQTFEGRNVVRAYRRRYGIDWLCAVKELRVLGATVDPTYIQKLEQTVESEIKANRKRKPEKLRRTEEAERTGKYRYSDENFYFIAGYTSGGLPYGITWEEAERKGLVDDEKDGI
jgi:hypothetical protein